MTRAVLLVSARPGLLARAVTEVRERHAGLVLVAPDHATVPALEGVEVVRAPIRRFGLLAGLRLRRALGGFDVAYVLAQNESGTGAENVLAAALCLGPRACAVSTAGERDLGWPDYLGRRASALVLDATSALVHLPLWFLSSILLGVGRPRL